MEVLTLGVALTAFIVGNIITFRMFFGRRKSGQQKAGALYSSLTGFAVTIGIVAAYLLGGYLICLIFS